MSGGSLDYVYEDVENALRSGYMENDDAEKVVRDIAGLLHDIEWSTSGDYAPNKWRNTLAKFCSDWEGGYDQSDDPLEDIDEVAYVEKDQDDPFAVGLFIMGDSGEERIQVGQGVEPGRYALVRLDE